MQTLLVLLAGALFAAGVYLVLRRNLLRMIFGLVLLSNAVNLLVFAMGRVARLAPPLVPEGTAAPVEAVANPLPQALVLTAIVIGFGLVSFALVLAYRSFVTLGTVETDELAELSDEPAPTDAAPAVAPPPPLPMTNGAASHPEPSAR